MPHALAVQISDIDTYQDRPSRLDQFQTVPRVPVIRVYGALATADGKVYNLLLHVHNCYPYLYVDCPLLHDAELTPEYVTLITSHFEKEVADSFRKNTPVDSDDEPDSGPDPEQNPPDSPSQRFISSVHLCRAVPVYGYNLGYSVFLKVSFFLPLYRTRFFKLISLNSIDLRSFSSKGVPAKPPQVYEAHLNYPSQFLADFNLQPCGWLNLARCHFRTPLVNSTSLDLASLKAHLERYITHSNVLNPNRFPRQGRSVLELDCSVGDILNRLDLEERLNHNSLEEYNLLKTPQEIHLASLRFTFEDLKFQCSVRGREDASQLLHELYLQVFQHIGEEGYRAWEGLPDYMKQLAFVRQMNRESSATDPNQYFETRISPRFIGKDLPTAFGLVGMYLDLKAYEDVPLLNYRDDLLSWDKYESFFEAPSPADIEDAEPEQDIPNSPTVGHTPRDPVIANSQQYVEMSSPLGIPSSPIETNPESSDRHPTSQDLTAEPVHPETQDISIFMATQRRKRKYSETLSTSTGSGMSQSLNQLLSNPQNTWELTTPKLLRKKPFLECFGDFGLLDVDYQDPAYADPKDQHEIPLLFANKIIEVPVSCDSRLAPWGRSPLSPKDTNPAGLQNAGRCISWQYQRAAPSKSEIKHWLDVQSVNDKYKSKKFRSQVEPAITLTNDFKYSLKSKNVSRHPSGFLNLSLLCMELHALTIDDRKPNPATDPIACISFSFDNANQMHKDGLPCLTTLLNLDHHDSFERRKMFDRIGLFTDTDIQMFLSEESMVEYFLQRIDDYDPDILAGYEVNASSWGYLCERFELAYQSRLISRLSKVAYKGEGKFGDRWGYTHTSSIKINGRHLFNVWRFLKDELKLTSYTLENISFHLLHQTLPKFLNLELSNMFESASFEKLSMYCTYQEHKVQLISSIIESQELVLRNVELSRLLGVDFYSNYYRGSQFKVEALLMRIAKPENMLLNSPTKTNVHFMRPLEVVPLIMEPELNFYKSPLVVLDFQSLYPSIMIAYNYCYLTLLGRIEGFRQNKNVMGYLNHHKLPTGLIDMLAKNDGLNISPNGLMFVKSNFRKSVLSRMLEEILNMRINVKSVALTFKEDKELGKLLHSKQLALKLIANVTYGYTSATFSGRMPNSDIADAIVATGRELMRRSIEIIEGTTFNAKVVYGDTDSLFVYFPGRTREYAFKHGKMLAQMVTDEMPDPVKLEFEKVYHPSVLLAKKRYVGHCYVSESQVVPAFEAKGIETIRRDGIPAQLKMVGKSLRLLFETKNLSLVKTYVVGQFAKILHNRVNVTDFCFAKGVRYGTYKSEQHLPPGAIVARKAMERDPRCEPQYKERVPYLVIRDVTKQRLRDRCVSPETYAASFNTDNPMELDFEYYITKVLVPPLERVFNLMGVNIKEWYKEMPKSTKPFAARSRDILHRGDFVHNTCAGCGTAHCEGGSVLCRRCRADGATIWPALRTQLKDREQKAVELHRTCDMCMTANVGFLGRRFGDACVNQDCKTYHAKTKAVKELEQNWHHLAKAADERYACW